jgi:class 3 adenylate cyclase
LFVCAGIARGTDFRPNPARRALMPLADSNWEVFLQASALVDFGWDEGKVFAQDLLRNASRDAWMKTIRANRSIDVTDCLPKVTCPVLVIHSRWRNDEEDLPLAAVRGVAAALPNARLVEVDYLSPMIFHGHVDEHLRIFESFFAEDEPVHYAHLGLSSGTAVILFTDIADSTALTERMGDAVFRAASRSLDAALRDAMRDAGGAPVEGKVLGDGVMAVFASAAQAIAAALRCIELSAEGGLQLHAGLHAGDVIREADNVYGGAVNIASRICGLSAPGEILVSATVRDLARTSAGVGFDDRGDHALKGIDDAVRIFAVRTEG